MPESLPVAVLDDDLLEDSYDLGSLTRGEGYAEEDRVRLVRNEAGSIDAVCRGSGTASYVVRVRWRDRGGDVEIDDACTCPLGGACKHCVASIIVARRQAAFRPRPPEVGDWRVALADLATAGDPDDDVAPSTAAVALQIVMQAPRPSPYRFGGGHRLTIRPLRRGRSGRWVKTGASWREVASPYASHGEEIDPRHRAALRSLVTSGRSDLSYAGAEEVPLGSFGPDVWHQLERAVEVGVALIGERPERRGRAVGHARREPAST